MRVQVSDHQHKSIGLIQAMMDNGVEISRVDPDILLIDCDFTVGHYPKTIEKAYQGGAEIVLYSHGAPVVVVWDSVWEPMQYTKAYLAQSPGQKWVMESYGYPVPITVVGWHFCPQLPFKPVDKLSKVLFAPWHPHGNGWMNPEEMELNAKVYEALRKMPYELTVRLVHTAEQNGLYLDDGVIGQQSNLTLEGAIQAIDEAELIVSNLGTFACLAVARGKPVVVYGQDITPHDGFSFSGINYVKHWKEYRDYMRYPYGIADIEHASKNEASDWRAKFIGDPLNADALMTALKGVLEDA